MQTYWGKQGSTVPQGSQGLGNLAMHTTQACSQSGVVGLGHLQLGHAWEMT